MTAVYYATLNAKITTGMKPRKMTDRRLLADITYRGIVSGNQSLAHRAFPDVEALERIIVKTELVDLLSGLPVRSAAQQLGKWTAMKNTHHQVVQILTSLGKRVTSPQAKRLNQLGLTLEALQDLRSSCKNNEEFGKALLQSGVKSKPLREKLCIIIRRKDHS